MIHTDALASVLLCPYETQIFYGLTDVQVHGFSEDRTQFFLKVFTF